MNLPARFEELALSYFAGDITDRSMEELTEWLRQDAAARARMIEIARQDLALRHILTTKATAEAVERVVAFRETVPDRTPRLWLRLAAIFVAALGLSVIALAAWMRTGAPGELASAVRTEGGRQTSATVEGVSMFGATRIIASGEKIRRGETIRTPAGVLARVVLPDSATIDIRGDSAVAFENQSKLRLDHGAVYCDVLPRAAAQPAFAIRTSAGHTIRVIGTKFQAGVNDGKTSVSVEEGTVWLDTGVAHGAATPLREVTADASGRISTNTVLLADIAPWDFGQEDLPAGTVLFEDHFEGGLTNWIVRGGEMTLAEKDGIGGSRALHLPLPQKELVKLYPKFAIRCRNFEIVYRFLLTPPPGSSLSYGFGTDTPQNWSDTRVPDDFRSIQDKGFPIQVWLTMKIVVRGDRVESSAFRDAERLSLTSSRVPPFTTWAIQWSGSIPGQSVLIDDVVIRKQ